MVVLIWNFIRLAIFAALLLPPFLSIACQYYCDARIFHGIRFGPCRRNFVDIYRPVEAVAARNNEGPLVPVVVAVMGGAWVIGHRAWNAQLGIRLLDTGVLLVAVDYRNFPCAQMPDMIDDVCKGVAWVLANIKTYGGDPDNVILMGQSAGAHLTAMALIRHALAEANFRPNNLFANNNLALENGNEDLWSVQSLRGYVGVSGPYDLGLLARRCEERGFGSRLLRSFCPNRDLDHYSPLQIVQTSEWNSTVGRLGQSMPPILLFHGETDQSVPVDCTTRFARALQLSGVSARADVRPGVSHTPPIVEGPMRGEDHQVQLLLPFLLGEEAAQDRFAAMPRLRQMWPKCIINLASHVMPF